MCPVLSSLRVLVYYIILILTISLFKWIIITNDIFETNALLEVNSKQPNILQFALTRVKRSKRQLQCDQFTSSTELVKPNYLVTLAVSILCTWFLTPERSVTQIRVGLEMNASLVSLHLNAKYCHPHNLRRLLISIRGWTHGHLFKGAWVNFSRKSSTKKFNERPHKIS